MTTFYKKTDQNHLVEVEQLIKLLWKTLNVTEQTADHAVWVWDSKDYKYQYLVMDV